MRLLNILLLAVFMTACQSGTNEQENKETEGQAVVYDAGFDCKKAVTKLEKTVCSDENLAKYDKEINQSYKRLAAACPNKRQDLNKLQRRWKQLATHLVRLEDKKGLQDLYAYDRNILRTEDCNKIDVSVFEETEFNLDAVLQKGKAFENPAKLRSDTAVLLPNFPAAMQWLLTTMMYFPDEVGSAEYDRISKIVLSKMKLEAELEEKEMGDNACSANWNEYTAIKDDPMKCFHDRDCLMMMSGKLSVGLIPCAEYIKLPEVFPFSSWCGVALAAKIMDNSTCTMDPAYQWPKGIKSRIEVFRKMDIPVEGSVHNLIAVANEALLREEQYKPDFTKGKNINAPPYTKQAVMNYDNFVRQQEQLKQGLVYDKTLTYDKVLTELTGYYQKLHNVTEEQAHSYAQYLLGGEEVGALTETLWYSVLYDPVEIVAQKIKKGNVTPPEKQTFSVCEVEDKCYMTYNAAPLLHLAVGRVEVLKMLFDAFKPCTGCLLDIDAIDECKNMTALHVAVKYGLIDSARFLIEKGANVNAIATGISGTSPFGDYYAHLIHTERNRTPLMYAARNGGLEMIRLLLNNGADKNKTDETGMTAFDYLAESKVSAKQKEEAGRLLKPDTFFAPPKFVSKELNISSYISDSTLQDGKKLILTQRNKDDSFPKKYKSVFFEYRPDTNILREKTDS